MRLNHPSPLSHRTHTSLSAARKAFLAASILALEGYTHGAHTDSTTSTVNYLRLCRVYIHLHSQISRDDTALTGKNYGSPSWHGLWNVMVPALARFAAAQSPEMMVSFSDDALQCLTLLDSSSHSMQAGGKVEQGDEGGLFPDALFAALSL